MWKDDTKGFSPLVILFVAAVGVVSGLALARVKFKLPMFAKGG
jgi:hypothetical protein